MHTFDDTAVAKTVDVALSDTGNQISERKAPAPHKTRLLNDAIVAPISWKQK